MNEQTQKTLRETIAEKIKTGKARMLPRWRFALKAALLAGGLLVLAALLLWVTSFLFFILHHTGAWFVPIFGLRGARAFLLSLPWLIVAGGAACAIALEILVRRYSFAWRRPLVYSLLGILVFVAVAAALLNRTRLHEGLFRQSREGRLPIAGRLYRGYGFERKKNVHIGIVASTTQEGFIMENRLGEALAVLINPETRFPLGTDFQSGDRVVVLGERDDGSIRAFGIRRVDDQRRESARGRGSWMRSFMK